MNKTKFLWLAVSLLLILNLSIIATVLYNHTTNDRRPLNVRISSNKGAIDNNYLRDELKFDKEQLQAARPALSEFRKSASVIVAELNSQKRQIYKAVTSQSPDIIKIDSISEASGNLHSKLKITTTNFYFALRKICNDDQLKKLNEAFRPMINGHENMNREDNPNGGNIRDGGNNRPPRPNRGEPHRGESQNQ